MSKSRHSTTVTDDATSLVKLRYEKASNQQAALQEVINAFEGFLAKGRRNFIFDLQNMPFPSSSFIAFLVAATMRARRLQGDVKLINVADSAKNNLVTFSALTYLSVEEHEEDAVSRPINQAQGNGGAEATSPHAEESAAGTSSPAEPPAGPRHGNIATREESEGEQGHHIGVESAAANLYRLCDFVTGYAAEAGMNEKDIGKIKIAVYEASLNVIEHAYHSNPDCWIDLWVKYTPEHFTIIIQDRGLPFELPKAKGYDVEDAMEKRRTGGFGLHIIQRSMDDIDYKVDPVNGNRLTMTKKLK